MILYGDKKFENGCYTDSDAKKEILKKLNRSNKEYKIEPVDIAGKNGIFYAAVKITEIQSNAENTIAVICLTNLTYNQRLEIEILEENDCPEYCKCPQRIFNLLTPTNDADAIEWRQKCNNHFSVIQQIKEIKEKIEKKPLLFIINDDYETTLHGNVMQIIDNIKATDGQYNYKLKDLLNSENVIKLYELTEKEKAFYTSLILLQNGLKENAPEVIEWQIHNLQNTDYNSISIEHLADFMSINENLIQYLPDEIQTEELFKRVLINNEYTLPYIPYELKSDTDFLQECIAENSEVQTELDKIHSQNFER